MYIYSDFKKKPPESSCTMTISIQKATSADIPAIAQIHVSGWQGAYGGILDQGYIESKTYENRVHQWTDIFKNQEGDTLIASLNGQVVGFISYGALRTAPPGTSKIRPAYSSEIYALYLLPEFFRQGVGSALIKKAVEDLIMQKHKSLCLWVLDKNKRACGFYEACVGQRVGKKMVEFGPTKAKEVCYGWRDITEILTL